MLSSTVSASMPVTSVDSMMDTRSLVRMPEAAAEVKTWVQVNFKGTGTKLMTNSAAVTIHILTQGPEIYNRDAGHRNQ